MGPSMSRSKKVFAVHGGEILKTKFMEPREWALMRWQTRWVFRASMRSSAETEPSAPTLGSLGSIPASIGAILAQSSERLRPQTCRGQRNRQKENLGRRLIAANSPASLECSLGRADPTSGSRERRCRPRRDIRHQRVGDAASISRRFFLRSMPQR
jgi:hypothetical protein